MSEIIAEISSPVIDVQVGNGVAGTPVVDNLTSMLTTSALSANQGRVLNNAIKAISYLPVTVYSPAKDDDFLNFTTPGIYGRVLDSTHTCTASGYGVLEVLSQGASFRLQRYTNVSGYSYMRILGLNSSTKVWSAGKWYKFTTEAAE